MVVPYSGSYPTINQLIGMTQDEAALPPTEDGVSYGLSHSPSRSHQLHFLHLLQEAERSHRDTLQRAVHAETQVQQLRLLFQQWQAQWREQHELQARQMVDQQAQQRQVQRQMQSLYDALLLQRREQLQVREKVDEVAALQQQHAQHAFVSQQYLEQMQQQVLDLDRGNRGNRGRRNERRSRSRRVRVSQSRRWTLTRWTPRRRFSPPPPPAEAVTAAEDVCNQGICYQDDCCPCEFPEDCPFNPCLTEDCLEIEIPDGPLTNDCFLRDIRLGLVQPPSCIECESQCRVPRETGRRKRYDSETESGYEADDEASLFSAASSDKSSAFIQERRQILQEVRSLENTRLAPRYREIWKPLRCFHCGKLDHLATFCPRLPTTIL